MPDPHATIRADLHNHTYYSPDSLVSPVQMLQRAREARLSVIAVTDHNTVRGGIAVRDLAAKRDPDIRVIVGEEVRTKDGEVLGLFLSQDIPPGLSAEETIDRIHAQGGLAGAPHPFDPLRSGLGNEHLRAVCDKLDFVEALNARMVRHRDNDRARQFAAEHNMPMTAASDAHSPREVGRCFVEMRNYQTTHQFLESLRAGHLAGGLSSPFVHWISRYAAIRHKLGWKPPA
ncbi:MAG TPA: PHP domain-containing protein [Dehalococcoidia bacterium]|jgi:predicted metal-dependent phosphoesterase TrpH|nr:PHP domain-containing protein [Dehalococcoidia bacterium]